MFPLIWDRAQKFAFLASSRVMVILLWHGPYSPCSRGHFNHLSCWGLPIANSGLPSLCNALAAAATTAAKAEAGAAAAAAVVTARVQTTPGPRGSARLSASVGGRGLSPRAGPGARGRGLALEGGAQRAGSRCLLSAAAAAGAEGTASGRRAADSETARGKVKPGERAGGSSCRQLLSKSQSVPGALSGVWAPRVFA